MPGLDSVERGKRELVGKLKGKEALFSERLPVPRDMVLLEDSDEEPVTD